MISNEDVGTEGLAAVAASLAGGVPDEQQRLDALYLEQLEVLGAVLADPSLAGSENVVRFLAPSAYVLEEMRIDLGFRARGWRGRRFGLEVGLLNLGFERQFAHSEYAENRLELTVRRVPAEPAQTVAERKEP